MSWLHDFKNQVRVLFGLPRRRRPSPLPTQEAREAEAAAEPEPVTPGRYPIAPGVSLRVYRESLTGLTGRRVELDEYQGA